MAEPSIDGEELRKIIYTAMRVMVKQANDSLEQHKADKTFLDGNVAAALSGSFAAATFVATALARVERRAVGEVLIDFGIDGAIAAAVEKQVTEMLTK